MRSLRYMPDMYKKSIEDIDFLCLYEMGKRLIFIDLDNTLVSYDDEVPSESNLKLFSNLKEIGFEVIIISNNTKKRVLKYSKNTGLNAIWSAMKPLKKGFKRGLKEASKKYDPSEVAHIGDQLITDIRGANKMKFYSILVEPVLRKSDALTTRFNRWLERRVRRNMEKHHKDLYHERLGDFDVH